MKATSRELRYEGLATDVGGTESYNFSSRYWYVSIWVGSAKYPKLDALLQGTIEGYGPGRIFQFTLTYNNHVHYARVLESDYNGLGLRYSGNAGPVPRYIIQQIQKLPERFAKGEFADAEREN